MITLSVCVVWSACCNNLNRTGRSLQHRHLQHHRLHSSATRKRQSDGSHHIAVPASDSPVDFPSPVFHVVRLSANTRRTASSQSGMTLLYSIPFQTHLQRRTALWCINNGVARSRVALVADYNEYSLLCYLFVNIREKLASYQIFNTRINIRNRRASFGRRLRRSFGEFFLPRCNTVYR